MAPDGDPFGLSATARAFLAGVLDHLPALVALTCPSYLSYARLQPSAWAASTVSWGFDNREAALRIASPFRGREDVSPNAELKTCDASSNPHLALGGLVLAGLDGLTRELTLPEPAAHDPAHLDAEAARRCGIRPLPHRSGDRARRVGGRPGPHGGARRPAGTLRARHPPGRVRALHPDGRRGRSESDFRGALAGACCRGTPRGTPGHPPP